MFTSLVIIVVTQKEEKYLYLYVKHIGYSTFRLKD